MPPARVTSQALGLDVQLALFEPDNAVNVAAVLRLAACLAVPVVIVEPCGFVWASAACAGSGWTISSE